MTDARKPPPPAAEKVAAKNSNENNNYQPAADEQQQPRNRNQGDENDEEQGTNCNGCDDMVAVAAIDLAPPANHLASTEEASERIRRSFLGPGAYRVDPIYPLSADHHPPLITQDPEVAEMPDASAAISSVPEELEEAEVELTPHLHEAWAVDDDVQVAVEICNDELIDNRDAASDEEQNIADDDETRRQDDLNERKPLKNRNKHLLAVFVFLAMMVGGGIIIAVALSVNKTEREESDEATATTAEGTTTIPPPPNEGGQEEEQDVSLLDDAASNSNLDSTLVMVMDDGSSIYAPPMPTEISDILKVKYGFYRIGILVPLAFSRNCSIVATSLVDEWSGIVQTIQYDDFDDEWALLGERMNEGNTDGDRFGASLGLSDDGTVMAVGMPRDDPNKISDAGSVRVYCRKCSNSSSSEKLWIPMGSDIHGKDEYGWFGTMLSLSADGTMIAASAPRKAANGAGRVRVHRFDVSDNEWKQVGSDILGEGDSMSIHHSRLTYAQLSADGNTIVVGAQLHSTTEHASAGSARIFRLNNTNTEEEEWVQVGNGIYGEAKGAQFGSYPLVSNDGSTLAFSGFGDNGPFARVYSYNSEQDRWAQVGGDFQNMGCVRLSDDGKTGIFCSVSLSSCFIYSTDNDSSTDHWKEMASFDTKRFIPLSFSRDDGREVCGIVQHDVKGSDESKFSVGKVPV